MKLNFGNAAAKDGEERIPAGEIKVVLDTWYYPLCKIMLFWFNNYTFILSSFTRKCSSSIAKLNFYGIANELFRISFEFSS